MSKQIVGLKALDTIGNYSKQLLAYQAMESC